MMETTLIDRPTYRHKVLQFRESKLVKVVTGVRRCGKSSILEIAKTNLEREVSPDASFITINLENREYGIKTDDDLYAYCKARMSEKGRTYIFLDEIQRIEGWHDVVNSMRVGFDCDIYVTGSNAFLLSGELATYLSGRYVEIKMLPLSFREYADFCGLHYDDVDPELIYEDNGTVRPAEYYLDRFFLYGGMPALASLDMSQSVHSQYMASLYDSIVVRDILSRERHASERLIQNPELLKRLVVYLSDVIGNQTSPNKIANTLTSSGSKTTNKTIASYIRALNDAYIFYEVDRFDIHGKKLLTSSGKEYIVDLGLRSYLGGYRDTDRGSVFENAVFLELLHRDWSVQVGKYYDKEVDFIATKEGRRVYIQVTDEMFSPETQSRELAPLRSIRDNFEKWVVVRQGRYVADIDGIRIIPASGFFLGNW